jgi:hypothetical protein
MEKVAKMKGVLVCLPADVAEPYKQAAADDLRPLGDFLRLLLTRTARGQAK